MAAQKIGDGHLLAVVDMLKELHKVSKRNCKAWDKNKKKVQMTEDVRNYLFKFAS